MTKEMAGPPVYPEMPRFNLQNIITVAKEAAVLAVGLLLALTGIKTMFRKSNKEQS